MTDNNNLKELLSDNEIYELKLAGLINQIESGSFMPDYLSWVGNHLPELELRYSYVQYIGKHIQDVIDGRIKKLAISIQPRIGKTSIVTIPGPVYYLDQNPRNKIILAAYNQTLSNKFSVKCRSLAEKVGVDVHKTRRARDDWETTAGGGIRAVGVGAGATGFGANAIFIDDPIKSRKEANSPTHQQHVFEWYTNDIWTRRDNDDCPVIMIGTRWHEYDLIGNVIANEGEYSPDNQSGWHYLRLPALAETGDPLGREPGEPICADRFTAEQLIAIQKVMGRSFQALYQCRPQEIGGGFFKRSWFKFVDRIPKEETGLKFLRFYDKASSESGDYTVGILIAYSQSTKHVFVIDQIRGRWSTYEREQKILETARKDAIDWGHVQIRWEREPGSSGIDSANASIKMLQGFSVRAILSRGDKVTRAEPVAAQCEAGNVFILKASWNRDFLQELEMFPNGRYDDIIDSLAGAFNEAVNSGQAFIKIS